MKQRGDRTLGCAIFATLVLIYGCGGQDADVAVRIQPKEKSPQPKAGSADPAKADRPVEVANDTDAVEPAELSELQRIQADPMAFFEKSLAETRKIDTFRSNFLRQERLGLAKKLMPAEHMVADYRDKPFSVRFTWSDEDSEYLQCVYIDGQNDNKVALLPRHGLFGLKPSVQSWPVPFAVAFHKTRNPITDFGLRRMMERTIDRIEKAKPHGNVRIKVMGIEDVADNQTCYHFELLYPQGDEFPCKLQDLYIDTETSLPVETRLWLTEGDERTPETLDAVYQYSDFQPHAEVTDEHFVIDINRKKVGLQDAEEVTSASDTTSGATE